MTTKRRMLASDGVNYWTEQPFQNRMRAAGALTAQNAGAQPGDTIAYFLIPLVGDENRPMVLTWDGDGRIDPGVPAADKVTSPNRVEFVYREENGFMFTPTGGAISNVKCVPLDEEHSTAQFKQSYLDDVAMFEAWRAMDALNTNASFYTRLPISHPADTWGASMSLEEVVALTNAAGVRLWANLPHLITDEAIVEAIDYLSKHCIKKPIVEFSNEIVWNWQFAQTAYASQVAPNNPNGWVGGQIAKMLAAARGKNVDVAQCGQFVNPWHTDMQFQGIRDAGGDPNELAIVSATTYVSYDFNDYGTNPDLAWSFAKKADFAGGIAYIKTGIDKFRAQLRECIKRATQVGAEFWGYEGGMWHMNASGSEHDWKYLATYLNQMQMHEDAADVLLAYENAFFEEGGDVQPIYNYASRPSEYGFFGAKLQPIWNVLLAEYGRPPIKIKLPSFTMPPAPPEKEQEPLDPGPWETIANERDTITVAPGTTVRYGANGRYVTKVLDGEFICGNELFGDPRPGVPKTCERKVAVVVEPVPVDPTPVPDPTPAPTPAPPPPPPPPADPKPTKDDIYAAITAIDQGLTKLRALVKAYRK